MYSSTHLPSDIEPLKAADAFKSQRDVLTDLLQHDLPNIASKLYTKSIISAAALAESMNQVHIASVRTVSLLSVVEDKIRAEPHMFTKFVEILESEPTLRSQAKELVEKYLKGKYSCYASSCRPRIETSNLVVTSWGHPTNFSMWSSKLYNLAEILLNIKSAKIHFFSMWSEDISNIASCTI